MVQGLDRLKTRMTRKIPQAARQAAKDALEQNAVELVAEMRRLVPVGEGDLRASIGWTWGAAPKGAMVIAASEPVDDQGLRIVIYAGNEKTMVHNATGGKWQNARLQEFGTKAMPPNPYFFTSYRKLKRRLKGRATRSINKAIRASQ